MFRELVRTKNKLSSQQCVDLLVSEKRGVLSVNGDNGYPYATPMNHFYNQDDGCIYFHCGKFGHRLDSLKVNSKASFCIYNNGFKIENDWALNVHSVIVFGTVEIIDDLDIIKDISTRLSLKFTNDYNYINNEKQNFASNTLLLKLVPQNICGKTVKES